MPNDSAATKKKPSWSGSAKWRLVASIGLICRESSANATRGISRISKPYGTPLERQRQTDAERLVHEYELHIEQHVAAGRNVVLFGPTSTGKDHLLACLLKGACRQGIRPTWLNGLDLYGDLRDRIDSEQPEAKLVREFVGPPVLAISDPLPPWGPLTPFQAQMMFRMMDGRYRAGRPIWVTINVADGQEASDRMGAAIVDRLRDGALIVHCDWPSYRTASNSTSQLDAKNGAA